MKTFESFKLVPSEIFTDICLHQPVLEKIEFF